LDAASTINAAPLPPVRTPPARILLSNPNFIDADSAMGLLGALGMSVRRTMGQIREGIIRTARGGSQEEKT
jgi:hypothetical protein